MASNSRVEVSATERYICDSASPVPLVHVVLYQAYNSCFLCVTVSGTQVLERATSENDVVPVKMKHASNVTGL